MSFYPLLGRCTAFDHGVQRCKTCWCCCLDLIFSSGGPALALCWTTTKRLSSDNTYVKVSHSDLGTLIQMQMKNSLYYIVEDLQDLIFCQSFLARWNLVQVSCKRLTCRFLQDNDGISLLCICDLLNYVGVGRQRLCCFYMGFRARIAFHHKQVQLSHVG